MGDYGGTLQIEYEDFSMRTNFHLSHFAGTVGRLWFHEKSFLNTVFGFPPYHDYKPTFASHADSPGVETNEKFINLSTIDKLHSKCDAFDGSVVNGLRQFILFSFVLDKPPGCKLFCLPEKKHY